VVATARAASPLPPGSTSLDRTVPSVPSRTTHAPSPAAGRGACPTATHADPARILTLLRALTPTEQAQFNTDLNPDGTQYSYQLGECSFDVVALTGGILERPTLTSSIPTIVGAYTGGPGPSTFLSRYATRVTTLRGLSRTTLSLPPPALGGSPL
jgi:hypothetical protein